MTAKAVVLLVLVCLLCPSEPQTLGHSIGKVRVLKLLFLSKLGKSKIYACLRNVL